MIVKVLGAIDIISAFAFLMLIFGVDVYSRILLICAGFLILKGMFIFTGEIALSAVDIFSAIILIIAIFATVPAILLWIPAFLLLAKGFVSFL